jgi:hypothetical protein
MMDESLNKGSHEFEGFRGFYCGGTHPGLS